MITTHCSTHTVLQYHADANEGESWIKEREPLTTSDDFGTSEASAKVDTV